jgi:hypothetical protein
MLHRPRTLFTHSIKPSAVATPLRTYAVIPHRIHLLRRPASFRYGSCCPRQRCRLKIPYLHRSTTLATAVDARATPLSTRNSLPTDSSDSITTARDLASLPPAPRNTPLTRRRTERTTTTLPAPLLLGTLLVHRHYTLNCHIIVPVLTSPRFSLAHTVGCPPLPAIVAPCYPALPLTRTHSMFSIATHAALPPP